MPDETKPGSASPAPQPSSPTPQQPDRGRGHPAMAEEMDSAKWTLPPIVPLLMSMAAVAIVVGLIVFVNRPRPSASGSMGKVIAAEQAGAVIVAIHVKFDNLTEKPLWIRNINSELQTADGKTYKDIAAPAVDVDRYLTAFPQLAEGKVDPLKEELKIPSKTSHEGMPIFSYPVDKAGFDARKSLSIRIEFYDRGAMVLKQ
jgi:hypothetical protein